jgi:vacuolar-type H+-ATPase subunit H
VPVLLPRPFPLPPVVVRTPPVRSRQLTLWENGVRYLTNEYQYVTLYIMMGFAKRGGQHLAMAFEPFDASDNTAYKVPAELVSLRDHFDQQARGFDGSATKQTVTYRSQAERNWVRNHYLHRSARLPSEFKIGMAGRIDAGRGGYHRVIIPDDKLVEKAQDRAARRTREAAEKAKRAAKAALEEAKQKANQAKQAVEGAANRVRDGAQQVVDQVKNGITDTERWIRNGMRR